MREVALLSSPSKRGKADNAYSPFKRFLDIIVSLVAIFFLSPIMATVAIIHTAFYLVCLVCYLCVVLAIL